MWTGHNCYYNKPCNLLFNEILYAAPGETPEQRLENALSSVNQRQARYGGMTSQQFQAIQEKRKQLWKKKVSTHMHSYVCTRTHIHTHKHTHTNTHTNTHTHTHTHTHTQTHTQTSI